MSGNSCIEQLMASEEGSSFVVKSVRCGKVCVMSMHQYSMFSRMASGGVAQSWYPSSHTPVPASAPQHVSEAPPVNLQEQAAVQANNNINVAGVKNFTGSF
jgi:hypothetical protein